MSPPPPGPIPRWRFSLRGPLRPKLGQRGNRIFLPDPDASLLKCPSFLRTGIVNMFICFIYVQTMGSILFGLALPTSFVATENVGSMMTFLQVCVE